MLYYIKRFNIQFIFVVWICLQFGANFHCNGFSVTSSKKSTIHEIFRQESSTLKQSPIVDNEDANASDCTSSLLKKCDPCSEGVLCVPPIQCPAHVRMGAHEKPQMCDLSGGKFGFCCTSGQNHTGASTKKARMQTLNFIPPEVVDEAHSKFQNLMKHATQVSIAPGHPDFMHSLVFHSTPQEDAQGFHLTNSAIEQMITTQVLCEVGEIPIDDVITNNIEIEFKETPLAHSCQIPPFCSNPHSKYRSIDGSCNNPFPARSHWGSAGQAMERILPPAYEDGIWLPRQHSKDGSLLPSARRVSSILMNDVDRPHPKHNLLLMQFGQFLAHDVSQSESVRLENGELVQCCAPGFAAVLPPERRHFACFPIEIDPNDDFYGVFGVRCMNFVRLSLAPNAECRAGYGKQRNKVTHYIDASPIYGSNLEISHDLRLFQGGRLRMFNDFGRELLPLTHENHACGGNVPGGVCYKSGDGRTNQIISLIALHTLFTREHNRIADILARLNPHANDELLYQEARRIVIAEIQHIVYNEYLPLVVGAEQMKRFRLTTQQTGYSSDYNPEVNPAITNEFIGAAFRMGHSSVDGHFYVQQDNGEPGEVIQIPEVMFNPSRMRKRTFYDDMLKTLLLQPMQSVDNSITHGLSRYMFRGNDPFGLDLAAINIQRGRDHGLRSYNDYLEVMGDLKIHSFTQLPLEVGQKLSQIYRTPDDIDLWVGGLLENPVHDGIVSKTFAEIIADQFSRLKLGDRYYYEYNIPNNPGAFNRDQLHEIRKVTMARIICDNADHLTLREVPPKAFVRADFPGNQPLTCDSPHIPTMNLEAWHF